MKWNELFDNNVFARGLALAFARNAEVSIQTQHGKDIVRIARLPLLRDNIDVGLLHYNDDVEPEELSGRINLLFIDKHNSRKRRDFFHDVYWTYDIGPGVLLIEGDAYADGFCSTQAERLRRFGVECFLRYYYQDCLSIGQVLSGITGNINNLLDTSKNILWRPEHQKLLLHNGPHYGFVYVIKLGDTGYYKIGRSNNPDRRIWKEITPILPIEPEIICIVETRDMIKLEKELHERYSDKRANGEWFLLDDEDIEQIRGLKSVK